MRSLAANDAAVRQGRGFVFPRSSFGVIQSLTGSVDFPALDGGRLVVKKTGYLRLIVATGGAANSASGIAGQSHIAPFHRQCIQQQNPAR